MPQEDVEGRSQEMVEQLQGLGTAWCQQGKPADKW